MINATINGINVHVDEGTSIFDAAKAIDIKIPSLCKHRDLEPSAACGICVVKIKGREKPARACCTAIEEGMDITTHSPDIIEVRKTVLELILSNHPNTCLTCGRNQNCELQTLAAEFGIKEIPFERISKGLDIDYSIKTIVLEPNKCIKCERCIQACQKMQDVWALSFKNRGIKTQIAPAKGFNLKESPCVSCGQCSAYCPVGAIYEYDDTAQVWESLNNPDKYCVAQMAPAVRVSIGEAFGLGSGEILTKKLYSLLRRMGFKAVFDTNFGADLTIVEESHEFLERLKNKDAVLPMISSCCPAWVDFMEKFHSDMIPHFSTCKSPHEMLATLSKTYYPLKKNIEPSSIFMVSIMPCIAKKFEIQRSKEMYVSGYQDVDVSITTREFVRMIKQTGIDFEKLPDGKADSLLGNYTGGGTIFGATGGVAEAALRDVNYLITGQNFEKLELKEIRGLKGVKEAEFKIGDITVRTAVAHGLRNVEYVIDKVRKAKQQNLDPPYHFIEVMACPGGCIGGGGQPRNVNDDVRTLRAQGLYNDDKQSSYRNCHENPMIQQLYKDFLGEPFGPKCHELLHLYYKPREKYKV